ncbi:MAG: SMP-30/gluconolactonase/LRE family protein [Nocardiopsaceae bacterium]|nr:SMP-30/gluconolactonase/LRE family protein [Nocardiopsaceae bacterium]
MSEDHPVREYAVEPVGVTRAALGEGPCWDAASGTLLWVDIPAGRVHRTDPATGATSTTQLTPPVSAVLPVAAGGLVLGCGQRVTVLTPDGASREVTQITADPAIRFNDAKADPRGRLWIGSMHTARKPGTATLYRLDPGTPGTSNTAGTPGTPEPVLTAVIDGVTISNGLGWSPDGRAMYYIDTPTLRVDVLDYDLATASAANRRPLVDVSDTGGRPDGLTVDADGCVWVALIGGGALHRYTPDGRLDTAVPLPVSHPTSCAFGGPGLRELFVTTASEPLSQTELRSQPLAGRLLRLRPGPAGLVPALVTGMPEDAPDARGAGEARPM